MKKALLIVVALLLAFNFLTMSVNTNIAADDIPGPLFVKMAADDIPGPLGIKIAADDIPGPLAIIKINA